MVKFIQNQCIYNKKLKYHLKTEKFGCLNLSKLYELYFVEFTFLLLYGKFYTKIISEVN